MFRFLPLCDTRYRVLPCLMAIMLWSCGAPAQDDSSDEGPFVSASHSMTAERLGELILNVDPDAEHSGGTWAFQAAELDAVVVFDVAADRMRIVIPIGPAENVPQDELIRMMQANFDSALDARYAIANDQLWGTYIHPLSELSDDEFLTALGETINVVLTYGTTYSSGLLIFRGGDSDEIQQRALIDNLRKKSI